MNLRTSLRVASFVPLLLLSILVAACSSRDEQAQALLAEYQAAVATGDLQAARQKLAELVAVEDGNAEYWIELGSLHAQAGAFNDAYFAFTRAHELDRGNVNVLQALTQLALRGGALEAAEDYAQQLELFAPSDPAVKLTNAYVALRRGDAAKADGYANQLLAASPYDSSARILKARVLLRQGRADDAVALLEEQVRLQPSDLASRRALVGLLQRSDRWARVVQHGRQLLGQDPADLATSLTVVDAALRIDDVPSARQVTLSALEKEQGSSAFVRRLLDLWARAKPRSTFNDDVLRLAEAAPLERKLIYAAYLNDIGDHRSAARLAQPFATLPVGPANEDANAVLATALVRTGQHEAADSRLNQILSLDPGHAEALRGRIELALRTGQAKRAIKDAQRLVTAVPSDGEAWTLLARSYSASGDDREAARTLWNGFHQNSANRNIYEALRVYVLRSQGPEAVRRLAEEYEAQRDAEMTREFV